MILSKKKLIEAVKVLDLIPVKPGVPSSEFIKVHAKDDDEGIQFLLTSEAAAEVIVSPNGGLFKKPFYIDRRVLLPFLLQCESLKSDDATVERNKESLEIKIGRRKLLLTALPKVAGYSAVLGSGSAAKGFEFDEEQRGLISCALKYAPVDESLQQLQCICMHKDLILSSNDVSIFCGRADHFVREPIKIPLYAANLINSPGVKKIEVHDNKTSISFGCGKVVQTLPAQVDKFPKKKMIEMSNGRFGKLVFVVEPVKLLRMFERFSTLLQLVKDKLIVVSGKRGEKKVQISSIASHAKFTDFLNVIACHSDFKAEWQLDTVLPFISFVAQANFDKMGVTFDSKSPYYLTCTRATLIMSRKSN